MTRLMRWLAVVRAMRLAVFALLALLVAAPLAAGYRDCFLSNAACAEYDWKADDAYVDAEGAGAQAGAGNHGSGDFRGRNAYLFAGSTYVAFFDGRHADQDQALAMASIAGVRLVYFHMDDRLAAYPAEHHCIEIGPGALYHRCASGLP